MTSLDETTRALWTTTKPPLGLLGAVTCGRAAAIDLSTEDRAPFEALGAALLSWWPVKKRSLRDISELELGAVIDHCGRAEQTAPLQLALDAAYHQLGAAMVLSPSSLRLFELGREADVNEETFAKLVRALAKHTHTDLELWKARMEHLLADTTSPWPALIERAARIGLGRPMQQASKLPKPLRELARLSDLGATASWSPMGNKHALVLHLGTTKRTAVLDDEHRATLVAALPWLA